MFAALGHFVYKRRWFLIGLWVLIFIAGIVFAPRVSSVLKSDTYADPNTESYKAASIVQNDLGQSAATLTVVFASKTTPVSDPAYQQVIAQFLSGLDKDPRVKGIVTPATMPSFISKDGMAAYAVISLNNANDGGPLYNDLVKRIQPGGNIQIAVTGLSAVQSDFLKVSEEDLRKAESFSLPLVLLALLVVFGTLLAAGAPLIIGAASVVSALAMIFLLGHFTDMSVFVLNVASMLGLGIAIDYSLFLVSRFREELRNDSNVERATEVTVATAGKAIFFSGATTFVGIMGLVFFQFSILRSIGIGGGLVVAISVLAALTFLPAVLAAAGNKVNRLPVVPQWGKGRGGSLWRGLANRVMRRAVIVIVLTVGLLVVLFTPFLSVRMGEPDATTLPERVSSRQGYDLLKQYFGQGTIAPITIAVQTDGSVFQPQNIGALYDFTREIAQDSRVKGVTSLVTLSPTITKQQYQALYSNPTMIPPQYQPAIATLAKGNTTLISVSTDLSSVSGDAASLVQKIRSMDKYGLQVYVGGVTAGILDIVGVLYTDFPWIVLLVVAVIYFALLIFFRSVVLPLKAVIMDGLSIGASYGALVFIFQQGHFSNILGFTPQQSVEASLPIIMFCMLFGISMDYEVFLLSRIKETYDATGNNTSAVSLGLERTGGIITSAALIMVLVTASFASADIVIVKSLGVGIALAIFLDATIVRALLVPATMKILGSWNWWAPGFVRKILPKETLHE